jgi:hypothetical protein
MYLAKFFHRPPGDDDRELLFIPGGDPMIIGIQMDRDSQPGSDQYLREEFSDIGVAVAAFRRHASELVAAGYVETTHTRYTLRTLLPDPEAKPEWQKGLDELMLAALSAPLDEQARHLAALNIRTPRRHASRFISGSRRITATLPPTMANEPSALPSRPVMRSRPARPARRRIMRGRSQHPTWKAASSTF